jgi:hypothetical protein
MLKARFVIAGGVPVYVVATVPLKVADALPHLQLLKPNSISLIDTASAPTVKVNVKADVPVEAGHAPVCMALGWPFPLPFGPVASSPHAVNDMRIAAVSAVSTRLFITPPGC